MMVLDRPGYYIDFCVRPLFQSLLRENLVYLHYYLPYVDITDLTNFLALTAIKNTLIK